MARARIWTLTAEIVRRLFDYDPDTGVLSWRRREDRSRKWNSRYAGTKAGSPSWSGHIMVSVEGHGKVGAHRLIWTWMTGEIAPETVDHKDTDSSNNRWQNLRLATSSQNGANSRLSKNSKSGLKGAYPHNQHRGKWFSTITVDKRAKYLGLFNCPAAAHFAYVIAANKWHGEFARSA